MNFSFETNIGGIKININIHGLLSFILSQWGINSINSKLILTLLFLNYSLVLNSLDRHSSEIQSFALNSILIMITLDIIHFLWVQCFTSLLWNFRNLISIHHWLRHIVPRLVSIQILGWSRIIRLHSLIIWVIYSLLFFYLCIECSRSSSCCHYTSRNLLEIQHRSCKYSASRKTISCTSLARCHALFSKNSKSSHLNNILSFSYLICNLSNSRKFKWI